MSAASPGPQPATIASARRAASALLAVHATAQLDADLLLCQVLGVARVGLLTAPARVLSTDEVTSYDALVARRVAGEPIAYLVGHQEFYGLDLTVSPAVLVPRADTETLVDAALTRLDEAPRQVLDLGTGSGAVALALASRRPEWRLIATDASADALIVALENCLRHDEIGVQLRLVQADWLTCFADCCADAIVANPPYVARDHGNAPLLRHEPAAALFAGNDGLDDLRTIVSQAPRVLKTLGWLLLEHGMDQGPAVRTLMQNAGFRAISTDPDLAGLERVTAGRLDRIPTAQLTRVPSG